MKHADIGADGGEPLLLASLMDLATATTHVWSAAELGAVFKHQMSAPVQFDLGSMDPERAPKLRTLCAAQGLLLQSFDDLFRHPRPPVELLVIIKKWARLNRRNSTGPLPEEVATVLYYGSIAAALVRCQRRISRLGDPTLDKGLKWVLARRWVTDPLRSLCREARAGLEKVEA